MSVIILNWDKPFMLTFVLAGLALAAAEKPKRVGFLKGGFILYKRTFALWQMFYCENVECRGGNQS